MLRQNGEGHDDYDHSHKAYHPEEAPLTEPHPQTHGVITRALAQPLDPSKRIFLYINGDKNRAGIQYVLNSKRVRTWEGLLTDWSDWIRPRFGAIRRVFTPTRGTELSNIHQLKNNGIYVLAGSDKNLKAHPHGYPHEDDAPVAEPFYHHVNVNKVDQNYSKGVPKTLPVYLSGHALPPYRIIPRVLTITVYRNGDDVSLPVKVTLRRYDLWNITRAKDAIGDKVRPTGGYVHSIRTLEGKPIHRVADIQNHGNYVVLGPIERFKHVAYELNGRRESFVPISKYHRRSAYSGRRRFTIRLRKKTRSTTRLHPHGPPTARRPTPPYRPPQPLRAAPYDDQPGYYDEQPIHPAKKSPSRSRQVEPRTRPVRSQQTQYEDMDEAVSCHTAMCELPQEIEDSRKIIRHIVADATGEMDHVRPSKTHSRLNIPSIELPEPQTKHTGSNTDMTFTPSANPLPSAIFGSTKDLTAAKSATYLRPSPSRPTITRSKAEQSSQSELTQSSPVKSISQMNISPSKSRADEGGVSRSRLDIAPSRTNISQSPSRAADITQSSSRGAGINQSPSRFAGQSVNNPSRTDVRSAHDLSGGSTYRLGQARSATAQHGQLEGHPSSKRDLHAPESGEHFYQRSDELHTYFPFAAQPSLMEMASDEKLRSPAQRASSLNMLLPSHPSVMSNLAGERSEGWNDLSAESGTASRGD